MSADKKEGSGGNYPAAGDDQKVEVHLSDLTSVGTRTNTAVGGASTAAGTVGSTTFTTGANQSRVTSAGERDGFNTSANTTPSVAARQVKRNSNQKSEIIALDYRRLYRFTSMVTGGSDAYIATFDEKTASHIPSMT